MDLGLKDRVALVTAGSRGFGLATALELAREGAHVAICARGEDDLATATAAVSSEASAAGSGRVLPGVVDVCDADAVERFATEVEHQLGPVELLLINAGGPPAGTFDEVDEVQWEAAYRLTLESAVRLCRRFVPGMRERGFGRVVQVTSVTVKQHLHNLMLSNVIRPAAHSLIKQLAREAAPDGVTLNSVAPGFHHTSAIDRIIADRIDKGFENNRSEVLRGWQADIPADRLGKPDELAALITFLMSTQAAYITGQLITADGGWTQGTF